MKGVGKDDKSIDNQCPKEVLTADTSISNYGQYSLVTHNVNLRAKHDEVWYNITQLLRTSAFTSTTG